MASWTKQEIQATRALIIKMWGWNACNEFNKNLNKQLIDEAATGGLSLLFLDAQDGSGAVMEKNTETNRLIEHYNHLQSDIEARRNEIETLRWMQELAKEKMPRLYYVQGFGQQGLAARIHFAGRFEDCKAWVSHNAELELTEDEQQIRRKDVPKVGSYPVAGMIASVTPVDKGWREISDMAELDKKLKEGNRNASE